MTTEGKAALALDPSEVRIASALTPELQWHVQRRIFISESQNAWRVARMNLPPRSRTVAGEAAATIVREIALQLDRRLRETANRYSALQWLWMLRRVPDHVFTGELSTTHGYDRTLAETLSGGSKKAPASMRVDNRGIWSFDTSPRALSELSEFCERSRFLSELHRAYRWICKGAPVEFSPELPPHQMPDESLRQSVQHYDARVAAGENLSGRTGTQLLRDATDVEEDQCILHLRQISLTPLPIPASFLGEYSIEHGRSILAPVRFIPEFSALTDLNDLGLASDVFSAALIFMMHAAGLFVLRHRTKFVGVLTRGYIMFSRKSFLEIVDEALAHAAAHVREPLRRFDLLDGQHLLNAVAAFGGNTWPLVPGPILRGRNANAICLDLATASQALETAIEPEESTGESSNIRANHFELSVQRAINQTLWAPNKDLATMRGKTLRLAGKQITDVDALGQRDGTLLLISCKSLVYRGANDIGDHRAVRNRADDITQAVKAWNTNIALLRKHPHGENYDFRNYAKIVGVVCISHLHWVPLGIATEEIMSGLAAASSLAELSRWLAT